jgi:hypothetical protein
MLVSMRSHLTWRCVVAELNYQVMSTLVLKVRALPILILLYLTKELVIGTDLSPIQPRLLVPQFHFAFSQCLAIGDRLLTRAAFPQTFKYVDHRRPLAIPLTFLIV